MQKFNNILLFGGETKNENMPVGFYSSLAMIPLRGKPVIYRQLENLKNSFGLIGFVQYLLVFIMMRLEMRKFRTRLG